MGMLSPSLKARAGCPSVWGEPMGRVRESDCGGEAGWKAVRGVPESRSRGWMQGARAELARWSIRIAAFMRQGVGQGIEWPGQGPCAVVDLAGSHKPRKGVSPNEKKRDARRHARSAVSGITF